MKFLFEYLNGYTSLDEINFNCTSCLYIAQISSDGAMMGAIECISEGESHIAANELFSSAKSLEAWFTAQEQHGRKMSSQRAEV